MSASVFILFFFSTFTISATPGPNMLLAFQHSVNHGVRHTLWVLFGLSFGLFILLVAALLGIDVISRQFPWLLGVLKVVGALYLIYLGVQSWRHADQDVEFSKGKKKKEVGTPLQRIRKGFWVSLSNPKAILFFAAFFPKFIDFQAPLWPQYLLLTVGFFLSESTWQSVYTFGGTKMSGWLGRGSRLLWLNRLCGILFILIALALLWEVV